MSGRERERECVRRTRYVVDEEMVSVRGREWVVEEDRERV